MCIVSQNFAQAQCVGSQTASMSPAGPYSAGQVVTVSYTLDDFINFNSNWIMAFEINLGNGWTNLTPITNPLNPNPYDIRGDGNWIWDTQNTFPSGLTFGPGWRFNNTTWSNYVLGNNGWQQGSPDWGSSSNGPFTMTFQVTVGQFCTPEDLSIDMSVIGDCQTGGWNGGSCCSDPAYSVYTGNSIPINNDISILDNTSDISCYGSSDGSISLNISSGISPFTYSWSNGFVTASINNLVPGSYDVIVTDAEGCTGDLNIIINEPLEIQLTGNPIDISCYGISDGSISLNITSGISPYTYSWSNGATTASVNNLSAGSYDVIVTDATGCTSALNNIIINEPLEIQISSNTSAISCYGSSDGSISLNISSGTSPYTYSWSNGATTAAINNLSAGSYDVIVNDATGCSSALNNIIINEASNLVYVLNTNDATCFGSSDGNASVDLLAPPTPIGTVSMLTYCASNPSNSSQSGTIIEEVQLSGDNNSITNNSGGVNDFYEDYAASMYADITEGQSYTINVTLGDLSGTNSYPGGAKVFIDYNIDGDFNDPGEDIGLIPVQTSAGILVPLSFTVPTTGAYGPTRMRVVCQSTYDFTTPNDIGPCESPAVGSWVNPWFGATEDYSIVLNNPNINATYLWSTNQTSDSIFGLSAGSYSVSITDDNGCVITENFTISSGVQITVLATADQTICTGYAPSSLNASSGGVAGTYSWTDALGNLLGTGSNYSPASLTITTTYTVSFIDFNGCVATDSVTITVSSALTTDPINHN